MLLPLLAEWAVILNEPGLYDLVKKMISENYPEIDLQIWFPESTSEDFLYTTNMSRKSGHAKCSIELYDDVEKYKKEIILKGVAQSRIGGYSRLFCWHFSVRWKIQ